LDIFSSGCVFYFVLTKGKHPFGKEKFAIQNRIIKGDFALDLLPTGIFLKNN